MTTPPRRRRPISPERQATVNDAMVPGSFRGGVPTVAPVVGKKRLDARARGITSVTDVTSMTPMKEQFTLAADGAQDLTLTNLPIVNSENAIIRSLGMYLTDDYTLSGRTFHVVNGGKAPLTGDKVQVSYWYYTGVPVAPTSSDTVDSPIAFYPLDETSGTTLVDSSGNSRNGTYSGSPTLGSTALVTSGGTSVTFNGSNYASIPAASIPPLGSSLSFEAWVATTSTEAIKVFLGCDDDTQRALQFRFNAGKPEVILLPFVGSVIGPSTKNDGNPHHCVATYDGSMIRLYVDGAEVASAAASGGLGEPPTLPWVIGNRAPGVGTYSWVGRIDNVGIYDYPLTATQVADHYAAGS